MKTDITERPTLRTPAMSRTTILLVLAWIVRALVLGIILAIIIMFLIVCELAVTTP